jgi:hypothetical protein
MSYFCTTCGGFTGHCPVGRTLTASQEALPPPVWSYGCTELGDVAVEFTTQNGLRLPRRVCMGHATEICQGQAPWTRAHWAEVNLRFVEQR